MGIPERLKELRKTKKVFQKDVANFIGTSLTGYAAYEQGNTKPSFDVLLKLSEFYNVSLDYLVGKTDIPYTQDEKDFVDKLPNLSLEQCINEYAITLDGQELTSDEKQKIIKMLKLYLEKD